MPHQPTHCVSHPARVRAVQHAGTCSQRPRTAAHPACYTTTTAPPPACRSPCAKCCRLLYRPAGAQKVCCTVFQLPIPAVCRSMLVLACWFAAGGPQHRRGGVQSAPSASSQHPQQHVCEVLPLGVARVQGVVRGRPCHAQHGDAPPGIARRRLQRRRGVRAAARLVRRCCPRPAQARACGSGLCALHEPASPAADAGSSRR